jgi:hypothetical protein
MPVAVALVIAGIGYALRDQHVDDGIRDRGTTAGNGSAAGTGHRGDLAPSSAIRWNDGVAREIAELQEDIEEFDEAGGQIWEETQVEAR